MICITKCNKCGILYKFARTGNEIPPCPKCGEK